MFIQVAKAQDGDRDVVMLTPAVPLGARLDSHGCHFVSLTSVTGKVAGHWTAMLSNVVSHMHNDYRGRRNIATVWWLSFETVVVDLIGLSRSR